MKKKFKNKLSMFSMLLLAFSLIFTISPAASFADVGGGVGTGGSGNFDGGSGDNCNDGLWTGPIGSSYSMQGTCSNKAPSWSSLCNVNDPVGVWAWYFRVTSGTYTNVIFSNITQNLQGYRANFTKQKLIDKISDTSNSQMGALFKDQSYNTPGNITILKTYAKSLITVSDNDRFAQYIGGQWVAPNPNKTPIVAVCVWGGDLLKQYCPTGPGPEFVYHSGNHEVTPRSGESIQDAILRICYKNAPPEPPTSSSGGDVQYRYQLDGSSNVQSLGSTNSHSIPYRKTTVYSDASPSIPGRGSMNGGSATVTNNALSSLVSRYGNGNYKSNVMSPAPESGWATSPGNWDSDYNAAVSEGASLRSPTVNVTANDQNMLGRGGAINVTGIDYYGYAQITKSQRKLIEQERPYTTSQTKKCTGYVQVPVKDKDGKVIGHVNGDCNKWLVTNSISWGSWRTVGYSKNWSSPYNTSYQGSAGTCAVTNPGTGTTGHQSITINREVDIALLKPTQGLSRNSNFNNCTQFFYTTQSQLNSAVDPPYQWSYTANHCQAGIDSGTTQFTDANYGGKLSKATYKNSLTSGFTADNFDSMCSTNGKSVSDPGSSQNDPWVGFRSNQFDGDAEGNGADGYMNNNDRSYVSTSIFAPADNTSDVITGYTNNDADAQMTYVARNANGTPDVKSASQNINTPDNFLFATNKGGAPQDANRSSANTFVNFADSGNNRNFTLTQWTDPSSIDSSGLVSQSKTGAMWNGQYSDFFAASNWASDTTKPQAISLDYMYKVDMKQIVPTSVNWNNNYSGPRDGPMFTSTTRTDPIKVWVHSTRGSNSSTSSTSDYNFWLNNSGTGKTLTSQSLNNIHGLQNINLKNYKDNITKNPSADDHLFTILQFVRSVGN